MSRTLAILGGGQLAQMLGAAAAGLGVRCRALDPSPDACAARTCELVVGAFEDRESLRRLVDGADALTFEFENVPASSLEEAARLGVAVAPDARALRIASDRLLEKQLFESVGMRVPPYRAVRSEAELERAVDELGCPLMLKARSGGYDGRSQARVERAEDAAAAWRSIGRAPCLAERRVELLGEVSVIACRGSDGSLRLYPLADNTHQAGILVRSEAPAAIGDSVAGEARSWATVLAEDLAYTGVLALELFRTPEGLMANEFAPRVHNTGHWTIEGAATSQFENHVRAVLGMDLGPTETRRHSVMRNLIGELPPESERLAAPGVTWHDYGKAARAGRKLGHVTLNAATPEACFGLESELGLHK